MSSKKPDVSVIICNHVVGELLYRTIASIHAQKKVSYEVIVLTSSEELADVGLKGCIVIHSTKGPAEKRNIGAKLAKADYLAFCDDDVDLSDYCLYELHKGLSESPEIGMVYGKLWNMEHQNRFDEAGGYLTSTGFIWSRAGQNDIDDGQYDDPVPVLAGKSASCMVKKSVFNEVGGFDEDFYILGEETDLSWRIWLRGYAVYFDHMATGYHAFNTKFKPVEKHYTSSRVQFNGCRNYITMLIKNLEARNLWRILPIHVAIWLGAGLVMLITGKVREGINILRGLVYVVRHLRGILRKRGRIQITRRVSDRDIWPLIFRRAPRGYYKTRILRYVTLGLHG